MLVLGDWGSTRLRLWLLHEGRIIDHRESAGIAQLRIAAREALIAEIAPWLVDQAPRAVVLCGMASARNGLQEVAYVQAPADATQWARAAACLDLDGIPVFVATGVGCTDATNRSDVMRGEEAQVFGAIALRPGLATGRHLFVLPGTHSKWVEVQDGGIVSIRTFLTGELFALLRQSSLLAFGSGQGVAEPRGAFLHGVEHSRGADSLLGDLFQTRVQQLLEGRSAKEAEAWLSGLLIGTEAIAGLSALDDSPSIKLVGEPDLCERYAMALKHMGRTATFCDPAESALAGLELIDATPR